MVFQLKEAISVDTIYARESRIHHIVMSRLLALGDAIILSGNNRKPKVGIYSFLVRAWVGQGWKFLSPPFVVTLLNDLFGIQSRSGCLCAGMYGQKLLGIDPI
jgi:selenocysteine lyase/cysteine desulfurase